MFNNQKLYLFFFFIAVISVPAVANNPLVKDVGMADPHVRIFDDKAYLYATMDEDPAAQDFIMPEWKIWSSSDFIEWKLERTIKPTETYMGESKACWATDAEQRNNKTYFYFSNGNVDTGVMVSKSPIGPFKDALGKPLLPQDLMSNKEYDATVLTDNDQHKTPYIAFGHFRSTDPDNFYYAIAKLNEDMISLAETPKKIIIEGDFGGNDKPTLHKQGDTYYLSAGAKYAISKNIYGPYTYVGFSGGEHQPFGLSAQAHGNYFEWRNQWFHVWCQFLQDPKIAKYRDSKMTYVHYKKNGEMVDDIDFLEAHYENGVGQYDAGWDLIQAEWYMGAWNVKKTEMAEGGFEISQAEQGGLLFFPHVKNLKKNTSIRFRVASVDGGVIEVRQDSKKGKLLGKCSVPETGGWTQYKTTSCQLRNKAGEHDLYLRVLRQRKSKSKDILHLDWFAF